MKNLENPSNDDVVVHNPNNDIDLKDLVEGEGQDKGLIDLLHSPWKLIKKGGKAGFKGVKRLITIVFVFGATNAVLFFYTLKKIFEVGFEFGNLKYLFLVVLVNIGATIFAGYQAYQFVVVDALGIVYKNSSSFFQRISRSIADKAGGIFQGDKNISSKNLSKSLDVGSFLKAKYDKLPKILVWGINLALSRVPFMDVIMDLKDDIVNESSDDAGDKLYTGLDGLIRNVFDKNNTNWVWWQLPLNIGLVIAIVKYFL